MSTSPPQQPSSFHLPSNPSQTQSCSLSLLQRAAAEELASRYLLRSQPTAVEMMLALGKQPASFQLPILQGTESKFQILCPRQSGKTFAVAIRALHLAQTRANSTVIVIAPTKEQSASLVREIRMADDDLGNRVKRSSATKYQIEFTNRSLIIVLPDEERYVRGYHADLLVLDEAALITRTTYHAARPFVLRTKGQIIALTTPRGKTGWFYDTWMQQEYWTRVHATWRDVPMFTEEMMQGELVALGKSMFDQEFECSFEGGEGILLPFELIATCESDIALWSSSNRRRPGGRYYIGIDLGRSPQQKGGRTVVWTWELAGGILWAREIYVMHGKGWQEQEHEIRKRLMLPGLVKAHIDAGFGGPIIETLTRDFPLLEPISLGDYNMGGLARAFRAAFESKRIRIPVDAVLRDDLQLVAETVQANGKPKLETRKNASGHADRFWAAALAYNAAMLNKPVSFGRPVLARKHGL